MTITSHNPRTGQSNGTVDETPPQAIAAITSRAAQASEAIALAPPRDRRAWLDAVADALETKVDELVALADAETALGPDRLIGEVHRAAGQIRFYGRVAVEGSYLDVAVDRPTPTSPFLGRVNWPVGPVAVFGASNFPFAFSVLGNDFGSAIAAGCAVVSKAHPAHVLLSLRLTEIAREALRAAGAPEYTLQLVVGNEAGVGLVQADDIAAVAFTGSQAGGLALWRLANQRSTVIPVFAEMGTVNPAVVTNAGAASRMAEIAAGFVDSFTRGAGQFCTKPGLLFVPSGSRAVEAVADALHAAAPQAVMLTQQIAQHVRTGLDAWTRAGATIVTTVRGPETGWGAPAAVATAPIASLQAGSPLLEEVFGPAALVVEYADTVELDEAIGRLQSSLAASVMTVVEGEDDEAAGLISLLSGKVGRVTVNDWPTGVAYTWAQQHGGPWPSTSNSSATSVGAGALNRFVRPVAFQSVPDAWLPSALQDRNPWRVPRRVDGALVIPDATEDPSAPSPLPETRNR